MPDNNQPSAEQSKHKRRFDWMWDILASDLLSDGDKAVGIALALHLNIKSNRCNPSASLLAVETSRTHRSVERHIAKLKKTGFLTWLRPNRRGSNRYQLLIPTERSVSMTTNPDATTGRSPTDGSLTYRPSGRPNSEENNELNSSLPGNNVTTTRVTGERPSLVSTDERQKIEEVNIIIRQYNETYGFGIPELITNRWHTVLVELLREGCSVDQIFTGYCKAAEYGKHLVAAYVVRCVLDVCAHQTGSQNERCK